MRRRGFTLIEALVSITLMTLVLGVVADVQRDARRLLLRARRDEQVERALSRSYAMFAKDCMHFQNPAFLPPNLSPIRQRIVSGEAPTGEITFYSAEYARAGAQEIRRITYKLDVGSLVRLSEPPEGIGGAAPSRRTVLVAGARTLRIALWDGKVFLDNYGASGRRDLPRGLRLDVGSSSGPVRWERAFRGELL